jgi:Tetratricopeptide repeat
MGPESPTLGPEHPDVAMTLNNLAVLCKDMERYTEAEPLYQWALTVFVPALGPTHPKVVTCRRNYAHLLRAMRRWDEARAAKARAMRAQT